MGGKVHNLVSKGLKKNSLLFSTSFNGKLVNGMLKRMVHSLLKPRRKTKLHQTGQKENIEFGFQMEGKASFLQCYVNIKIFREN